MRVAAVDLGTNSTRLLVADVNGALDEVVRRLEITRLGEGVDERRRLLPVPIARVRNVLSDYRRELEALGAERTLCIGTSAVRDAENGEAFLGEIEWSYGFTTRLLSGDEEAELTLRGIGALEPGTLVVDIGGGSTEVQVVGSEVRESLDVGCVRMTERFGEDVSAIREHVRALLPSARPERAVGVAGTVTTIAALDLGLERVRPRADSRPRDLTRGGRRTDGTARVDVGRGARSDHRARPCAGDRRRRGDPVRDPRLLRPRRNRRRASATSSTAPRSPQPSCPRPKKAPPRPAPTPAADADRRLAGRARRALSLEWTTKRSTLRSGFSADISVNTKRIVALLEEDDGEEAEED